MALSTMEKKQGRELVNGGDEGCNLKQGGQKRPRVEHRFEKK